MSDRSAGSLEPLLEQVRFERDHQLRHIDALDTKVGVLLGFAAVLVAFAPRVGVLVDVARYIAAGSGLIALTAFWPRRFPVLDLQKLRLRYLGAEIGFTRVHLLDTQIAMYEQAWEAARVRARRVKGSMVLLAVAVILGAVGLHLK